MTLLLMIPSSVRPAMYVANLASLWAPTTWRWIRMRLGCLTVDRVAAYINRLLAKSVVCCGLCVFWLVLLSYAFFFSDRCLSTGRITCLWSIMRIRPV